MNAVPADRRGLELLAALRAEPLATALFCDLDGTLAPIVERPEQARVPDATRELLRELAARYGLVGCVSGRRATEVRRIVGIDELLCIGNHGFERLDPGCTEPIASPALASHEADVEAFAAHRVDAAALAGVGIRIEDKGAIRSLHWRGAPDEAAAEQAARAVAAEAVGWSLVPHWGRKVLELRPPVGLDKGTAVAEQIEERRMRAALYAGDDRTDVDAFRALEAMRATGDLRVAVRVAIASDEGPVELREEADLVVADADGFISILRELAT
jgi:trehalose-phosphatase